MTSVAQHSPIQQCEVVDSDLAEIRPKLNRKAQTTQQDLRGLDMNKVLKRAVRPSL